MEDRSSDGRRWQTARPRRYGGFISFITQARSVLTTWRHHAAEEAGAHTCVYRHAHAHSQTHIHTCIDMDTQDIHTGADTHTHTHTHKFTVHYCTCHFMHPHVSAHVHTHSVHTRSYTHINRHTHAIHLLHHGYTCTPASFS